MNFLRRCWPISLFVLTISSPGRTGMPFSEEMTCPVGGEKFAYIETASYSQWGSRPDGKPYGSWKFPIALPECPSNRLVLYKEFSTTEIKMLTLLIKSPEYVRLKGETGYYRAAWLMKAMDDGKPIDRIWMTLQASWQADDDPDRKARYQREFAEGVAALPTAPESLDWIVMSGRAANAWRELGDFERSSSVIKTVSLANLDVPIPEEKVGGTPPNGLGKVIANLDQIDAAKTRRSWIDYFKTLAEVIARGDSSSEPLDMIPSRVLVGKCMAWEKVHTAKLDAACHTDEVRAQITRARELQAKLRDRLPPSIHSDIK